MEEMTNEEKAKAYDEALKYAMIYYKDGNEDMKTMMKTCFPILVEESKDERICGKLIAFLKQCKVVYGDGFKQFDLNIDDAIAWLEKQGRLMKALQISNSRIAELVEEKYNLEEKLEKQDEQKPFNYENANIQQKDFAPKQKAKFHEGDWVVDEEDNHVYMTGPATTVFDGEIEL